MQPLKPRSTVEQATADKHQQLLHEMQNQIIAMKGQYQEHELPFRALNLAFESLRIAWYAAVNDVAGCQMYMPIFDAAEFWLTSQLFPPFIEFEPAIPLPVFDWEEAA